MRAGREACGTVAPDAVVTQGKTVIGCVDNDGVVIEFQFRQMVQYPPDAVINQEGQALAKELRGTLESASGALQALSTTLNSAEPAAKTFNEQTLPSVRAAVDDIRETSKSLRAVTERLENQGAGSLLGSQPLPDYEP